MKIWQLFSIYSHPLEKRFDKLIRKNSAFLKDELTKLMQENLVVILLWVERKFKRYKHLKKKQRRKLNLQADKLILEFKDFQKQGLRDEFKEVSTVLGLKLSSQDTEKLFYLYQIMQFLKPGQRYEYLESTSFDRLLSSDNLSKMIGDCNQIVGLYLFLYSQKYPILDLKLTLLPEHVALHFAGLDIEATTATFHRYQNKETVPVSELIAISILDIPDEHQKQMDLSTTMLLESAQVAYKLSSKRELVEQNLKVAYHNLALEKLTTNNFREALKAAKLAKNSELIAHINLQAVRYFGDADKYQAAKEYLGGVNEEKRAKATKWLMRKEVDTLIKEGNLDKALAKAELARDPQLITAISTLKYNQLQAKTEAYKTRKDQKNHIDTYKKMLKLAIKLEDPKLEKQLKHIISELQR